MAMTALPAAPSRSDPANFATRGDALMTALPTFVTEANALQAAVLANQVIATAQAAIATATNSTGAYKGLWSALTGALNMPASVWHNDNFWLLNANLANVTTATPGVSASWTSATLAALPQVSQSAAYTAILSDAGKHILHPSADTTARVFTIPANASVAYPIGTTLTFVNQNAAGVITISITTDVMRLAVSGATGNRTLVANGIATAVKITATEWLISGMGLS